MSIGNVFLAILITVAIFALALLNGFPEPELHAALDVVVDAYSYTWPSTVSGGGGAGPAVDV